MANLQEPSLERIKKQAEAIEKLQMLVSDRIGRILQFTNLYFVFQGMIFSYFMSSTPQINCKLKWIPFALSLLVSIFNFLAVWVNIYASLKLYEEEVENWRNLDVAREMALRRHSAEMSSQTSVRKWDPHSWKMPLRIAVSCSTLLLLFVFMGVMLWGCFQIECVITAVVTKD